MILKNVLVALLICLTLSGCGSWGWEAKPWAADSANEYIVSSEGTIIACSDPQFSEFLAFHYTNIAELKAEIDKIKMRKSSRAQINTLFKPLTRMLNARPEYSDTDYTGSTLPVSP